MAQNADYIARLIIRQLNGDITEAERTDLEAWIKSSDHNKEMAEEFLNDNNLFSGIKQMFNAEQNIWNRIEQQIAAPPALATVKRMFSWKRWAVAASIIFILAIGAWFLFTKPSSEQAVAKTQEQRFKNDVNPGGYKARLTLSDGSIIVLDSAQQGQLAKQGNVAVLNKSGQLVYEGGTSPSGGGGQRPGEVVYNTLATARGETYATTLSDGTKVWLNSASSIKYPVAFNGSERRVELTGEAYFEVKHNAAKPFKVLVNGMEIEDLGTEFNINAYSDEPVTKTTLLQGAVKVTTVIASTAKQSPVSRSLTIKPGEQAVYTASGQQLTANSSVDLESTVAWKNGTFSFDGADVQTIMRAFARWYDLNIDYQNKSLNEKIHLEASRNTSLKNVLKVLELTSKVRFEISGKTVTVKDE